MFARQLPPCDDPVRPAMSQGSAAEAMGGGGFHLGLVWKHIAHTYVCICIHTSIIHIHIYVYMYMHMQGSCGLLYGILEAVDTWAYIPNLP